MQHNKKITIDISEKVLKKTTVGTAIVPANCYPAKIDGVDTYLTEIDKKRHYD